MSNVVEEIKNLIQVSINHFSILFIKVAKHFSYSVIFVLSFQFDKKIMKLKNNHI